MNKINIWIKRKGSLLMDWIYNKKPRNKYLRIPYYFLTGIWVLFFATLLIATVSISFFLVLAPVLWLIQYLVDLNSFMYYLTSGFFVLFVLLLITYLGHSMFKDD